MDFLLFTRCLPCVKQCIVSINKYLLSEGTQSAFLCLKRHCQLPLQLTAMFHILVPCSLFILILVWEPLVFKMGEGIYCHATLNMPNPV